MEGRRSYSCCRAPRVTRRGLKARRALASACPHDSRGRRARSLSRRPNPLATTALPAVEKASLKRLVTLGLSISAELPMRDFATLLSTTGVLRRERSRGDGGIDAILGRLASGDIGRGAGGRAIQHTAIAGQCRGSLSRSGYLGAHPGIYCAAPTVGHRQLAQRAIRIEYL